MGSVNGIMAVPCFTFKGVKSFHNNIIHILYSIFGLIYDIYIYMIYAYIVTEYVHVRVFLVCTLNVSQCYATPCPCQPSPLHEASSKQRPQGAATFGNKIQAVAVTNM